MAGAFGATVRIVIGMSLTADGLKMIVLLDTPECHEVCAAELGMEYGELLTPLTRRAWRGERFGIDNGAFSGFNPKGFSSLLKRMEPHREKCIFVACPDVPMRAMRTLELFKHWAPRLEGWPLAYVAQNGQEHVEIPWGQVSAVFIGGDDQFKLGGEVAAIVRVAKGMGKWVHVGRINSPNRADYFGVLLDADSMDGTGIARYTHMRENVRDGLGKLFETTN